MDVILFGALFTFFGVIYYLLGMAAGRHVHTEQDYFLANRSLGFWSLTGTLLATQLGGGMILGTAEHSYDLGFYGMFYSIGMAAGFLILGLGFAGKLRSFNIATTAELFEQQFGSVRLKKVASFLSILSLIGLFLAQVVASKSLMVGLGVHSDLLFVGFWATLIIYTMYGGLPAVVATDILQVIIILVTFCSLSLSLWWQGMLDPQVILMPLTPVAGTSHSQIAFLKEYWFIYIGMPLLFSLVEQDLAQRFFAARSKTVAMLSSLTASLAVLVFAAIPVCLGIQARLAGVLVHGSQNPLITFIATRTSPFMYALVMCALIAAIASTADSLLCAISSNAVQDFVPETKDSTARMVVSRYVTAISGIFGIAGAYAFTDILSILTQSYQLLVSSILVAVLVCFTSLPRVPRAATLAVAGGFCTFFFSNCSYHLCHTRPLDSACCFSA